MNEENKAVASHNGDDGSVDDLSNSRYLKQADVGDGIEATIRTVVQENIAARDEEPELGRVVLFNELEKGLVLNKTKGLQIAAIAGSKKFRDWRGVRIELWADPTVTMKGKVTGGIRVRRPGVCLTGAEIAERNVRQATANALAPKPDESDEEDDGAFDLDRYSDADLRKPEVETEIREIIENLPCSNGEKVNLYRYLNQLVRRAKANAPGDDDNEVPL